MNGFFRIRLILVACILLGSGVCFAQPGSLSSEQLKLTKSISKSILTTRSKERARINADIAELTGHFSQLDGEINALEQIELMSDLSSDVVTKSKGKRASKAKQAKRAARNKKREDRISKTNKILGDSTRAVNKALKKMKGKEKTKYKQLKSQLITLEQDIDSYRKETDRAERKKKIKAIKSRFSNRQKQYALMKSGGKPKREPTFTTLTKHK